MNGSNNEQITKLNKFLDNIFEDREENKFEPQYIYNCDETGVSTVLDLDHILAQKCMTRVC